MVLCVTGERVMISCRSWRINGRNGFSEDIGHVSDIQRVLGVSREGNPARHTAKFTEVVESNSALS